MGLDIDALNARRAGLCQLKGGGAAHWLSSLAPQVSVGVYVLSDVAPCGPEVVGSGPFWDGTIQHRVLADNSTWVKSIAAEARRRKINVLHCSSGRLGSWQSWMQSAIQAVMPTLRGNENGLFIFGGEPSVRLPSSLASRKPARGGRQSHLALALAHRLRPWIIDGKLEILGMSSDGSDGNSGAAGAWLDSREFSVRFAQVPDEKVRRALKQFRSAEILSQLNALVKSSVFSTRSNVQDVLMIRVL
jgi:glycerate-2-kinase